MPNLIESSEFGDWLLAEISTAGVQARAANDDDALAARQRLKTLKVAKKVLLEFLTIQQAMFETASVVRRNRPSRLPSDGAYDSSRMAETQNWPE